MTLNPNREPRDDGRAHDLRTLWATCRPVFRAGWDSLVGMAYVLQLMADTGKPLPAASGSGRRIVYQQSTMHLWVVESDGRVCTVPSTVSFPDPSVTLTVPSTVSGPVPSPTFSDPLSGFSCPVIMRKSVVLPAPFGPITPTIPPGGSEKFTFSNSRLSTTTLMGHGSRTAASVSPRTASVATTSGFTLSQPVGVFPRLELPAEDA
mgnify:CR=1 FL=1